MKNRLKEILETLIGLEAERLEEIKDILVSELEIHFDTKKLFRKLSEEFDLDKVKADAFMHLFLGILPNMSADEQYANTVLNELRSIKIDDSVDNEKISQIVSWLETKEILDKARLLYKTTILSYSNPAGFDDCKIISDLRPVCLGNEDELSIEAMIITHNLTIDYSSDKEKKSFTVSLTLDNLIELKKQISRAEVKDKLFKSTFDKYQYSNIK